MRPECTNHITCTTVDGASEMDDGLVERRQDKLHVGQNILLVGQNKLHVGHAEQTVAQSDPVIPHR